MLCHHVRSVSRMRSFDSYQRDVCVLFVASSIV